MYVLELIKLIYTFAPTQRSQQTEWGDSLLLCIQPQGYLAFFFKD